MHTDAQAESLPFHASPFALNLDDGQKARAKAALVAQEAEYDSEVQLLRVPFKSPGYHTTLTGGNVHPTRESAAYAVDLLDCGDEALKERAIAILRQIVSLQDTDPASKTYGIWSWFADEPLTQMAPPDWNWADFIGVQLLQVGLFHRNVIPRDLMAQIDAAISHACRSIMKRQVKPDYTNIAIMDVYVTLMAGELLDNAEFRAYGLEHLQIFHDYTRAQGGFSEYNSPTYTIVALEECGRLRAHVQNDAAKPLIETIYRAAWQEIAEHFHVPTRQWAGPHSRSYATLLNQSVLTLIQHSTENRVDFGLPTDASPRDLRLPLPCPRDLEAFFTTLHSPRQLRKSYSATQPPIIATTYLAPQFALGTINRGDLWNQCRSLVAYAGDATAPCYLHLRLLHDGYDFSAAQFFSAQQGGSVVAAINFATDGGDTHISLDPFLDATFSARDLRLRLEMGGAVNQTSPQAPNTIGETCHFQFGDTHCQFTVPFACFGALGGRWESGQDEEKSWLDVILYEGPARTFDLKAIEEAAIGLMLHIGEGEPNLQLEHSDGHLQLSIETLRFSIPTKSSPKEDLQRSFKTSH